MYRRGGLPLPSVVDLQPSQDDLSRGSLYRTRVFDEENLVI